MQKCPSPATLRRALARPATPAYWRLGTEGTTKIQNINPAPTGPALTNAALTNAALTNTALTNTALTNPDNLTSNFLVSCLLRPESGPWFVITDNSPFRPTLAEIVLHT